MIRLAVFDLDGTLVDSRRDLADAANALVMELGGIPIPEHSIGDMVGEGAPVLVQRVLTAAGLNADLPGALTRFLALYDARLLNHTRPYEGIVETLEALRTRMPLAVLTNKPQAATDRMLDGLDLARFFQAAIGGDTALGRKPATAGLIELSRRAGVDTGATVLVGDSPIDLETARRAGSKIVLVCYGFGYRHAELRPGEWTAARPADLANFF